MLSELLVKSIVKVQYRIKRHKVIQDRSIIRSMVMKSVSIDKDLVTSSIIRLEKCSFYYRKGIQKYWIDSNTAFLDYIARRFGQSVRVLLTVGKLVVIEVDESLLHKFKTEEDKKKYLEGLVY